MLVFHFLLVIALAVPLTVATSIARRQVSIAAPSPLPSQCTTACATTSNEVSLGCPVTACCTTTFENQYYNCLECVGMANNVANFSSSQNSLNLLYTTCVDMGFVLPRLELPGQANGSSSASGPSPTGSASSSSNGAPVGLAWCPRALFGSAILLAVGLW